MLPSYPPSFWNRLFGPILPRVIERVIREASCGVFLTSAASRFICEDVWGRSGRESDAALDHPHEAMERKTSPALLTEDAFASAEKAHRAAA